jgi:hypothetical protein
MIFKDNTRKKRQHDVSQNPEEIKKGVKMTKAFLCANNNTTSMTL